MTRRYAADTLMAKAVAAVEDDGTILSALIRLLDCLDDHTADCVDNSGRPYQSQALYDRIRRGRQLVSPGDPQP